MHRDGVSLLEEPKRDLEDVQSDAGTSVVDSQAEPGEGFRALVQTWWGVRRGKHIMRPQLVARDGKRNSTSLEQKKTYWLTP